MHRGPDQFLYWQRGNRALNLYWRACPWAEFIELGNTHVKLSLDDYQQITLLNSLFSKNVLHDRSASAMRFDINSPRTSSGTSSWQWRK